MRVIVTGGAGFIGSNLCRVLLEQGHKVVCVDNFVTGAASNIEKLADYKDFRLLEADVVDPGNLKGLRGDFIYHLASPASPIDYANLPVETLMVNSMGTKNMLDVAIAGDARLLLASTSEVYGDPLVTPQSEDYWGHVNPTGPRSCYDEAKRFGEAMTMAYMRTKMAKVHIVRIFNTFGPHMRGRDGRVVPNFILQALNNEPLTIYGKGRQTRSFCYVSDLVAALMTFLGRPELVGEVINLGNPSEMTVLELAKVIIDRTGSHSELTFEALPENDPMQRRPDIRKAASLLGWEPVVGLEEGLDRTIEWFKELVPS